jgi:Flp pilus assembly protein TadD
VTFSAVTTNATALADQALAALQQGQLGAAERLSAAAYRDSPADASVVRAYAATLSARERHVEARAAFERLCELEPGEPSNWVNLGTALRATADLRGARQAYERARELGEDSADFHFNLAMLLLDLEDVRGARTALDTAARLAPRDAEIRFQHARVCFAGVDTDATAEALADWRRWEGLTPELCASLGSLLLQAGEQDDALMLMQRAEAAGAGGVETALHIVSMLERVNRVDEAQRRFDALAPPQSPELRARWKAIQAQLASRRNDLPAARLIYEQLLAEDRGGEQRQGILFPLAKVLDSLGEYDAALRTVQEAHDVKVATTERIAANPVEDDRPIMPITRYSASAADVAGWREPAPPSVDDSPVFIVAFPRSGTTLLELMLDAHPNLRTMDEQPFLQKAVLRFGHHGLEYPHALAGATPDQIADIRRFYWAQVAKKVRLAPGQRLIDKNPLNMLRLPAIKRLFPNSPVLMAIRHPCDVIISNFFQHFRAPEFVRLCRDLPTLALGWRRAFDYWYEQQALVQASVLEVRYETFVADFAAQARAIAGFLQLPWDDAMLEPARHARDRGYISTPSYSQVVQPVNTKAVGRWRRYESAMGPVIEEVRPYLERWGYDA